MLREWLGIGLLVEGGAPIAFFPLSLLHLLNCLILLPDFSCFCSSYSLSHPTGSGGGGKGGSEQMAVCGCLAAGWGQPIASILFYCDVFLKNSFSFSYYLLINCSLLVFKRYFLFPPSPRTAFCLASSKSETPLCTSLPFHYTSCSQPISIYSSLFHAGKNTSPPLLIDRTPPG